MPFDGMQIPETDYVAAVDMGGTEIKCGAVSRGAQLRFFSAQPVLSGDAREPLLDRIAGVVRGLKGQISAIGGRLCGVAVSTPGPFDYAAGTSGMRGKYDSIFGVDLRAELRRRVGLEPDTEILFMQDAAAFLLGELTAGSAAGVSDCSCVTLGTGVGYACMLNGKMLLNDRGGPYCVFAFQDYGGQRIEDLISGRAVVRRFGTDGKTLAARAHAGDAAAAAAFYDVGYILGAGLTEIPETAKINRLIIGGQMAYSFDLMADGIAAGLLSAGLSVETLRAARPAEAALLGAAHQFFKENG